MRERARRRRAPARKRGAPIALCKCDGPAPPGGILGPEHEGIAHLRHAHDLPLDFGGIHVFSPRYEHIARTFEHGEPAPFARGGVAREEEPVRRRGRSRVEIAAKDARPAHGKLPRTRFIGIDHTGFVAGKKPERSGSRRGHLCGGDLARRFGHAVAGVYARLGGNRPAKSFGVRRGTAQKQAPIPRKRFTVIGRKQILQHLIDHRGVRRSAFTHVGKHSLCIEPTVQDKRSFVEHAAYQDLKSPDVKHRKRRLP